MAVVIRLPNSSRTVVANILHRGQDRGRDWIVLDRLVHTPIQSTLGGWQVSGALTSELHMTGPAQ